MFSNTKCGFSCLQFAIQNSLYSEFVLKPKQVICLEKVFFNSDVFAVLPTGYGKSFIFYLLPALLFAAQNGAKSTEHIDSMISLIKDQISRLNAGIIRASVLDVRDVSGEDFGDLENEHDDHDDDDDVIGIVCAFLSVTKQNSNKDTIILYSHTPSHLSPACMDEG